VRFVADSMVGRLARWLRVLGYDTHYQSRYEPGEMERFVSQGRTLLTRHRGRAEMMKGRALLIHGNGVGEQISLLKKDLGLEPEPSALFSRCLGCNVLLRPVKEGPAEGEVPEYVLYQNRDRIRFCPSCGRYFWPGSHRMRMEERLREWGFSR